MRFTKENTYSGKEVLKGSKWYPVSVKAKTLQEANKMVNQKNTKTKLRGRFSKTN